MIKEYSQKLSEIWTLAHVWNPLSQFQQGDKVWIKRNSEHVTGKEPQWWITNGKYLLNVTEEVLRWTVRKDKSVGGSPREADPKMQNILNSLLKKQLQDVKQRKLF